MLGHQGPGSVSEALVRDLLQLQGTMAPSQIISLMDYFGADNAFAMSDHADHVHVGYTPLAGPGSGSVSKQFSALLKPEQWERLIDRLGEIDNPEVPTEVSEAALPAGKGKGRQERQARLRRAPVRVAALRFPFVQLELAGTVGLEDGRYLEPRPERVLVVQDRRRARRHPAAGSAAPSRKDADPDAAPHRCR